MDRLVNVNFEGRFEKEKDGFEPLSFSDSLTESCGEPRESITSESSAGTWTEEAKAVVKSSSLQLGWPIRKAGEMCQSSMCQSSDAAKNPKSLLEDFKVNKPSSKVSDIDLMKERFGKLLLGEDMSGSGKGVCTALAISNAITNLCGTVFGQLWRLEPVSFEKKSVWSREMEWLLCVSDHIVEFIPSSQTFPDGTKLEVMTCKPRSDLLFNLPALRKLDTMLLEILDGFVDMEFWYVDQGIVAQEADGSTSFRKSAQRQEDKWWLPVPRVPSSGLSEKSRKQINHIRECTSQILKASLAINNITLSEMEVPNSYLEALPKNGRACLGDNIYRYITSDKFSAECLLDCLDLSSDHVGSEVANQVEAAIYVWQRRSHCKPLTNPNRSTTKTSWEMVKDLMVVVDKREFLAKRAQGLLLSLKHRCPSLTQTTLDTTKIQFNKDIGKSILESYSRVLESLAFNIVARIDDLLYVDDLTKHSSEKLSSVPGLSVIARKKIAAANSTTPFKANFNTLSFSPAPSMSPAIGERTPFINITNSKSNRRGLGVKRVLNNYLGVDAKANIYGNQTQGSCSITDENGKESSVLPSGSKTRQNPPRYTVS